MDLLEFLREEIDEEARRRQVEGDFVAFDDWDDAEMKLLTGLGTLEPVRAGATIIEMGTEDRDLFIVVAGELETYRPVGREERRVILVRPGDLIGEMAFIDGKPRSASVRALEESHVLRIRAADVERLCRDHPAVGLKFMREIGKILSARLRRMSAAL